MPRYVEIKSSGLNDNSFRIEDLNTGFNKTSTDLILREVKALNNEIANILTTTPRSGTGFTGERHFEPEFGALLLDYVFDPTDELTKWRLMNEIIVAVERWIPTLKISTRNSRIEANSSGDGFELILVYEESRLNEVVTSRFLIT